VADAADAAVADRAARADAGHRLGRRRQRGAQQACLAAWLNGGRAGAGQAGAAAPEEEEAPAAATGPAEAAAEAEADGREREEEIVQARRERAAAGWRVCGGAELRVAVSAWWLGASATQCRPWVHRPPALRTPETGQG